MREIRRKKQELSKEETEDILRRCTSGVLSVIGDDGYPYGVPMSYAYKDDTIVFHSANKGHKLDALRNDNKVSFSVIDKDQIVAEEYTTYFRSAISFGKVKFIEDDGDKRDALIRLVKKYSLDYLDSSNKEIESKLNATTIFVMEVERMSGKAAIELTK